MDLLQGFLEFLEKKDKASKLTVKNYKADISQFIAWLESFTGKKFDPKIIDHATIDLYKKSKRVKDRSFLRHLSSLRKFFIFLKSKRLITSTPFEKTIVKRQEEEDLFFLNKFKTYLLNSQSSYLTVKNYIIDLKQFFIWAEKVTGAKDAWELKDKNIFDKIDRSLIEEYKIRLTESGFSPLSVNRKLSSLRKYLSWVETENLIRLPKIKINNLEAHNKLLESKILEEFRELSRSASGKTTENSQQFNNSTIQQSSQFSPIPPIRLVQKISKIFNSAFDSLFVSPLANFIEQSKSFTWKLKDKPLFQNQKSKIKSQNFSGIQRFDPLKSALPTNIKKISYAPLDVSTKYFSWHKRLLHHARYTRPEWYKRYHSYSITHYFHLAILMIFMSAVGFEIYQNFIIDPSKNSPALASSSPPRILSFQGRLTDSSNNPITNSKLVRFQIYDHLTSTGSGHLKWQELDKITPDSDGVFSVLLGNTTSSCTPTDVATGACKIPQSLFGDQPDLYLGVTIENNSELSPRQELAAVAYATNAELLQGMPPTTDSSVTGNTNAVLALNSSGTMAIAGTATTTFQATSGQFKLTGKPLRLETNSGTGGNIELFPDGIGKIDLQKPIINSTNNGNFFPGAVEVNDTFAVIATNSAASAFIVNNNTTGGNIMSASSSGTTRFVIDNSGNVGIGSSSPLEKLDITGNATISGNLTFSGSTSSISATAMNTLTIGGSTTGNITIDSGSSSITLSDNTTISGDLTLSGGDITGANGAMLDIGEANSGDITVTGDMIFADNAFIGLGASAGRITFDDQSTDEIEITGNVGIGNATPLAALDVVGSASISANLSLSGAGTAHTFNILQNGTLNFQISVGGDAGAATALFIQNNGNVGIGTTAPAGKLHVSGSTFAAIIDGASPTVRLRNTNTRYRSDFDILSTGVSWNAYDDTGGVYLPIQIDASKTILGTQGNVGINNTTPLTALDVTGSASLSANLSLRGAATAHTFNILDNGTLNIQRSPGGDAGIATALFVQNNGKIGIGTTDPLENLDISGNATMSGTLATSTIKPPTGALNLQYKSGADAWTTGLSLQDVTGKIIMKGIASPSTNILEIQDSNENIKVKVQSDYTVLFSNIVYADGNVRTPQIYTWNNGNLTLAPAGTGDLLMTLDSDTDLNIGSGKLFVNGNSGNIGVGTTNPGFKLDLSDSQSATVAAQIFNTNTETDADGLIVKLGNTSTTAVDNANHFLSFETSGIGIVGSVRGSGATGVQFQTTGIADFAEYLKKDENEDIPYGSIVCINNEGKVFPCISEKDTIVGITSKSPTILGGKDLGKGSIAVGLTGQVRLKVSPQSGEIKSGDYISSSNIPGIGVKQTKAGQVVGKALESCDSNGLEENSSNSGICTILIVVNPSWYDPDVYLADTGSLQIRNLDDGNWNSLTDFENLEKLKMEKISSTSNFQEVKDSVSKISNFYLQKINGEAITRVGAYKELVTAKLKTGLLETENAVVSKFLVAKNISTQSLSVTTDSVTVVGVSLKDYVEELVLEALNSESFISQLSSLNSAKVVSPLAEADEIRTRLISPLASDSVNVAGKLVIKPSEISTNSSSLQGNLALEVQGSASISGELSSNTLSSNEASIAGTLRAGKIVAQDIEGLEDKIASIASTQKTISDQVLSTSEEDHGTNQNQTQNNTEENFSLVPSDVLFGSALAPDASLSAQLAYIENLSADFARFNKGLISFGPTSLADTSIAGQLYIGSQTGGLILADNTINTLGSTLELQPLRQGSLSIMAGLIHIDTDGNAVFGKDVTVKGTLAANIISPLPNSDLVFRLGVKGDEAGIDNGLRQTSPTNETGIVTDKRNQHFVIQNSSNSGVLSIDQEGNLAASGSGRFSDLLTKGLNIVRSAQADTSLTETIATSSAGTATIIAGETQRTILSPFVTEKSLIYITVTSDTQGVSPFLARQVPYVPKGDKGLPAGRQGSFTIEIPNRVYKDINLNWWIVN